MVSQTITITCRYGLHMLPSVRLSEGLSRFYGCQVTLHHKGKVIDAKSVMDLVANFLPCGAEVTLVCDGRREAEALAYLTDFIQRELLELSQNKERF